MLRLVGCQDEPRLNFDRPKRPAFATSAQQSPDSNNAIRFAAIQITDLSNSPAIFLFCTTGFEPAKRAAQPRTGSQNDQNQRRNG